MWVLIDAVSKERLSERFSSQAKLAKFMGFSPKTLNKAVNEERNKFQFRGREVTVVNQKVNRFSVHESPDGPPLKKFETETELAKWLGVTRQAVYMALRRSGWLKSWKIRKDKKDYFIQRFFDKEPIGSLPEATGEIPTVSQKPHTIPVKIISASSSKIYPSVSAATTDLGIDARTIHEALKSGRNYFTRRSDGTKFQVKKAYFQSKQAGSGPQQQKIEFIPHLSENVVGKKALDGVPQKKVS